MEPPADRTMPLIRMVPVEFSPPVTTNEVAGENSSLAPVASSTSPLMMKKLTRPMPELPSMSSDRKVNFFDLGVTGSRGT
ncbi:hypothetical protein D3C87_1132500 [compost metagenome]